jgi:hypothetical protein
MSGISDVRTENALRKTKHCMMPSIVSPVRQNVPVRWRPLRPMAEAVTTEADPMPVGTRAVLEAEPRGRLLLLPAEEAAARAGMRRCSESMPTNEGLRTVSVQTFILPYLSSGHFARARAPEHELGTIPVTTRQWECAAPSGGRGNVSSRACTWRNSQTAAVPGNTRIRVKFSRMFRAIANEDTKTNVQ